MIGLSTVAVTYALRHWETAGSPPVPPTCVNDTPLLMDFRRPPSWAPPDPVSHIATHQVVGTSGSWMTFEARSLLASETLVQVEPPSLEA